MATMKILCWRQPPMSDAKRARLKQWIESGEAQLHPLTFSQRELWETSPAPVSDVSNHICCILELRGKITEKESLATVQHVVDRQEVLRLSILPGKSGPLQLIRKHREPVMTFRDVPSRLPSEGMEELALETFSKPFDLVQGPLYRIDVWRRAPDDHAMV